MNTNETASGIVPDRIRLHRHARLARVLVAGIAVTWIAYIALTAGHRPASDATTERATPAAANPSSPRGLSDGILEMPGADPLLVDQLATHG